ncbi:undecaprenyl/decaprenyl-phosphate alpha-N-acetylglucosaminyl 1-phosphate transferase [Candidatus Uhrbacteria bacterium]|nr:undecaprenyl/decaprenyl-phosphate alpha-N-acetylglucosaminyl 1-phosphate transferase [Candidatus Uhrbacteria bacterium]
MVYIGAFLGALVLAGLLTSLVRKIALRFRIVDVPGESRKIHTEPIPLLGGIAPFLSFAILLALVLLGEPGLLTGEVPARKLIGFIIAGAVLMVGGFFDDRYKLRPSRQIIFPILAALIVIASGIGIREITNPFGGVISFIAWQGILLTFLWLMGMMYTTKVLDGLDGLVSGLTVIGAVMVFFFTTTTQWFQPEVGLLAVLAAGAFLGFLPWNFHPAKIFLGEGGSLFAGFLLGTLAVISGGKIATTLLVVGIPLLDAAWVIARRLLWEGRSPARADRKHLHFRLLDVGFSHRAAVIVLWAIAALFGTLTLVLQSKEKLVALGILLVLMVIGAVVLVRVAKRKTQHQ